MHTQTHLETTSSPRRKKRLVALGLSAALILASGAALAGAGHPWRGAGGMPGIGLLRLAGNLDLSEQQEVQVVKIRRNLREQGRQLHRDMNAPISTALDELQKPKPDASKLHGLADETLRRVGQIAHSAIDQFLALHATFSTEQRDTLVSRARAFQEHAAHRGDHEAGGNTKAPRDKPANQ